MNLSNWLTASKIPPPPPINPVEFESDFILTKLRRKMGEQIILSYLVVEIGIIIVTLVSE
jgi:hypothetical protein